MPQKKQYSTNDLKFPLSLVGWSDSCEPAQNAEVEAHEIPEPQIIIQAGHLVKETKEYVSVAGAWKPELLTFDYVITIPRHAILRIERLNFVEAES